MKIATYSLHIRTKWTNAFLLKWSHIHKLRSHVELRWEINQQGTDQERIIGKKSQSQTNIRGRRTRATRIPTYETPEPFRLCNQVLGIQGKHNISPKLANPTSSCIHPSTHNQETFGNHLPQPSKSIRYTSYGNTPELPPQYWVASRLSHQQLHKRDFRCRRNSGIPELQR